MYKRQDFNGGNGGGGDGGSSSGGDGRGGNGGTAEVLQYDLSENSPSPLLPCSSTCVGSVATSVGRQEPLDRDATNAIPRTDGAIAHRDGGDRPVGAPHGSHTADAGVSCVHSMRDDIRSGGNLSARSGGVVDLSLDSPSPPPPHSRTHAAAQPPQQTGVGISRSGGGGGVVEPFSSDDEFAM